MASTTRTLERIAFGFALVASVVLGMQITLRLTRSPAPCAEADKTISRRLLLPALELFEPTAAPSSAGNVELARPDDDDDDGNDDDDDAANVTARGRDGQLIDL